MSISSFRGVVRSGRNENQALDVAIVRREVRQASSELRTRSERRSSRPFQREDLRVGAPSVTIVGAGGRDSVRIAGGDGRETIYVPYVFTRFCHSRSWCATAASTA